MFENYLLKDIKNHTADLGPVLLDTCFFWVIFWLQASNLMSIFFLSGFLSAGSHQQGKSQYFIESPRNQTVNEGDSILLKCQVGNLLGIVQWTRAGFAMGEFKCLVQYFFDANLGLYRPLFPFYISVFVHGYITIEKLKCSNDGNRKRERRRNYMFFRS